MSSGVLLIIIIFVEVVSFCAGLLWWKNGKIVRCRDCKHYYEAENYHPSGNYVMQCCKYFDVYNDEVEPDGFCKWGRRKGEK